MYSIIAMKNRRIEIEFDKTVFSTCYLYLIFCSQLQRGRQFAIPSN